jgi:hypothetical protein
MIAADSDTAPDRYGTVIVVFGGMVVVVEFGGIVVVVEFGGIVVVVVFGGIVVEVVVDLLALLPLTWPLAVAVCAYTALMPVMVNDETTGTVNAVPIAIFLRNARRPSLMPSVAASKSSDTRAPLWRRVARP